MKVFLAGEGPDELGDWARETVYQGAKKRGLPAVPAIIETLLTVVGRTFVVLNGTPWRLIQKYRPSKTTDAKGLSEETKSVLRAAQDARDAEADALVFVRDSERDRYGFRAADIEKGIKEVSAQFPELAICGGVAKQEIEAWILALLGNADSESHIDAKKVLRDIYQISNRADKIKAIETASFAGRAKDSASLELWISRAKALPP